MITETLSEDVQITVIAQKNPEPESREGVEVLPVFDSSKPISLLKIAAVIRKVNPDAVIFNQSIGLWGQKNLSNIIGMSLPLITKSLGYPVFSLLHNVYEEMDIENNSRVDKNILLDIGVRLGTLMLLYGSDKVSVTRKDYKETLEANYRAKNIVHIPHGIPVRESSYEEPGKKLNLLAFGHWSPHKNLSMVIDAFEEIEDARLTVAGTSHPDFPDYLEDMKNERDTSSINFTGYVPEDSLDELFADADLAILPYNVSVGTSGVLNLAMGYGVPVLATDREPMKNIETQENSKVLFCDDTPEAAADKVEELHDNPSVLEEVAEENHQLAEEKSMKKTCEEILSQLKQVVN